VLAIIGGSGLAKLANMAVLERKVVCTPYGVPSSPLSIGRIAAHKADFLARHGHGHTIPPHEINYRANLWALQHVGVQAVISVSSVGGIRPDLDPGTIVIPDQIIDYTHSRKNTFFETAFEKPVMHIDFTWRYSTRLRKLCLEAAGQCGQAVTDGGTYAATQGPRLETAAEICRLENDGADMVGMTGMPEASLARELELDYAVIGAVVNWAAGKATSGDRISQFEIEMSLTKVMARIRHILEQVVERFYESSYADLQ
jgi:5'-methylthioadenosine phosphorylase